MGIAYGFSKATINNETCRRLSTKTKLSHEDVEELVQSIKLSSTEENQLRSHELAMAANDIFERITETDLFSEEEKYIYYTFFANLFWFEHETNEQKEKYVLYVRRNDLDVFGINSTSDRGQSKYEWLDLKFAKNVNSLKSIVEQSSMIDFERLQYVSIYANIGWEFSRITTYEAFRKYIMDWLSLFKQCIKEDKWLIAEYT